MSGNKTGGKLAAETNKKRHGEDFYKNIGSLGGKTPTLTPKGFAAMSLEKRQEAGRKGGLKSKRKAVKNG